MLQVAAVLGSSFAPHDLAEMLGERPAQLLQPLKEALAAGLLRSDSGKFVFHREPVWRAVLGTVPEPLRSMLHRQAATMLLGRAQDEIVAAAVHLVHCAEIGDTQAVVTIHQAAERLLPASPEAAAALAIRGLRITEPGGPNRIALGSMAAAALIRLGRLSQAVELTQELLHANEHVCVQSTCPLRTWLATALMLRGDTAAALNVSQDTFAATPASAGSVDLSPELLLLNTLSHYNLTAAIGMAEQVLTLADEYSVDVRAAALTVRAMADWRDGRLDAALESVEEAVGLRGQLTRIWQCDPLWTKAWILTRLRKLDDALVAADTARRTVEAHGTGVLTAIPLALRATILLAKGDIAGAEADAAAGLAASERAEMPLFEPQLGAVLVLAALRRGDLATAADGLRRLEETTPAERAHPSSVMLSLLAGLVASAKRGAHAAVDEIREVALDPAMRKQLVLEDPSATAWSVRTAMAADERALAELVVGTAEEVTFANQRHESVVAAARHGRALLDGDLTALTGLQQLYSDPWAVASVTEDLGSLQRATDREQAVAELNRAMTIYDEVGAEWDSARVRRKLRRLGVRRRHWNHKPRPEAGWDSLTGTEEKVARLVARGLTNRQVAKELFISPHTVGFHLRQVYRKLSIQSRVDLARIAP